MTVSIPLPALSFPSPGWVRRYSDYVDRAACDGVVLATLEPPCIDEIALTERALSVTFPSDLLALYEATNGLQLGFIHILSLERMREYAPWIRGDEAAHEWRDSIASDLNRAELIAFAEDLAGNFYAYDSTPGARHRVVYICHDPYDAQHRFTSLATFLDAWVASAYASSHFDNAEKAAGRYIDPKAWTEAARALECVIDPDIVRTIDD